MSQTKAGEGNAFFSEGKYEQALASYSQDVVSTVIAFTLVIAGIIFASDLWL